TGKTTGLALRFAQSPSWPATFVGPPHWSARRGGRCAKRNARPVVLRVEFQMEPHYKRSHQRRPSAAVRAARSSIAGTGRRGRRPRRHDRHPGEPCSVRRLTMSSSAEPVPVSVVPDSRPTEIVIISHSPLFYWWPVWLVGFIVAAVSYLQGDQV